MLLRRWCQTLLPALALFGCALLGSTRLAASARAATGGSSRPRTTTQPAGRSRPASRDPRRRRGHRHRSHHRPRHHRHRSLRHSDGAPTTAAPSAAAPVVAAAKPAASPTTTVSPAPAPPSNLSANLTPPSSTPLLHASGTQIVDGSGNPVQLRGVDLGGWLLWEGWIFGGGYVGETSMVNRLATLVGMPAAEQFHSAVQNAMITQADIAEIAELGFNVVRVPINYRLLEDPDNPFTYNASGWAILDDLVQWCEEYHVYIVFDMHAAPGGQAYSFTADSPSGTLLWGSPEDQNELVGLWQAIAGRYAADSVVAGYDLLNEPWGSSQQLSSIYARTIAAIRSVDRDHMIFLEGAQDSRDFSWATAPLASNIVYSPHIYRWSQSNPQQQLDEYVEMADAQRVPLWIGEFGENSASADAQQVAMFNAQSAVAGWAYWTWKQATPDGVYEIPLSADWKALVAWLSSSSAPPPTLSQATQGMQDLLSALKLGNETQSPGVASSVQP